MQGSRFRLKCLLASAALAIDAPVFADGNAAADAFLRPTGLAPVGFEELAAPQHVFVDVYFGGRIVVSTMATVTPQTIRFDHPDEVVASVPDLVDHDVVRAALDRELPTNAARLCTQRGQDDCGTIDLADGAAVIFDADRFRAELFVAARHLALRPPNQDKFLPPSESGLSFLQNFVATGTGATDADSAYTVNSLSTLAFNENRAVALASYTDQDDLTVDALFAQRDFEGVEYAAGLFRTAARAVSFTSETEISGVRIASSLNTRTDLPLTRGTPIDLFLSGRARVDLLREGRLVSSRYYDAGNNLLDTSALPEGAYEITIRINESGRIREETRFFSKTSRVPPADQPLYSMEIGRPVSLSDSGTWPNDSGEWLARFGHSRRIADGFGLDVGIAATDADSLLEAGAFRVTGFPGVENAYVEGYASTFVGSDDSYGFALNGQFRRARTWLSLDYRRVVDPGDPGASIDDNADAGTFRLLPGDLTEAIATLQLPLRDGSIGFTASRSERKGLPDRKSQTSYVQMPLARGTWGFAELRTDLSRIDGDLSAFVGIRVYFRRGHWNADVTPGYVHADDAAGTGDGAKADAALYWYDPESAAGDLRLSMNGSYADDRRSVGGTVDYDHALAQTRASIDTTDLDGRRYTSWAGTIATSVVGNRDAWTIGAQNSADSAVLVTLDGSGTDADFDVLIDGYERGTARVGRTTAIHLPPFQSYDVRIRPRNAGLLDYEDRSERVTLYPGNVAELRWPVAEIVVVFGRAVDALGAPLAQAVVDGVLGLASTDDSGFFQAELLHGADAHALTFRRNGAECRVDLPALSVANGVANLGTLVCIAEPTVAKALSP